MKTFKIELTEQQARYIAASAAHSLCASELTFEEQEELELIWGMIHAMIDEGDTETTHCFHL